MKLVVSNSSLTFWDLYANHEHPIASHTVEESCPALVVRLGLWPSASFLSPRLLLTSVSQEAAPVKDPGSCVFSLGKLSSWHYLQYSMNVAP